MKAHVIALALAATSCYRPDVGDAVTPPVDASTDPDGPEDIDASGAAFGCDNKDSDPATPVSFSLNVRPLLIKSPGGCIPCHLGRATSGLDQSSYQSLRRGGLNSGTRIIVSGEPCNSIYFQKIGRTPPFGSRMPFNGPPYFSAAERQIVHDWIAEGALNN
jgi:hypothetical protein